jgi:hypothetical protein
MSSTKDQLYKLSRHDKYKIDKEFNKIDYVYFSRALKRQIVKQNKNLAKLYKEDQEKHVLQLREKIEKRRQEIRKEVSERFEKQGKNLNNTCTQKSITFWTEKKLTIEFGFLPEHIEDCSLEEARKLLFRNYTKEEELRNQDDIFETPDEQLDPISRLAKHDPVKYVSTMQKLELYKKAKKNGRLGMWQDQHGRYHI